MSRFQELQHVVTQVLDPNEATHWNPDGTPSVAAVTELSGIVDPPITQPELNKFSRKRGVVQAVPVDPEVPPPPTVEELEQAIMETDKAIDAARTRHSNATRAVAAARSRLAEALREWQSASPGISDAELRREFIASEQRTRKAMADGTLPPRSGNRSGE